MIFSVPSPAESTDLDVLLDDAIVEAAWKRRVYPKRILEHVVHSLRAERKLMVGVERLLGLLPQNQLKERTGPLGHDQCEKFHLASHTSALQINVLGLLFSQLFCVPRYVPSVFQGLYENAVSPEEVLRDPDQGYSSHRLLFFYCHLTVSCYLAFFSPVFEQKTS